MKWFLNMKIKAKMFLSFLVVISLMIWLAVVASLEMTAVDEGNTYASDFPGAREVAMLELSVSTNDLRRVVATMTMYAPLNDASRIEPLISEAGTIYLACMDKLDKFDVLVRTDPVFSQAEKDAQLEKTSTIRLNLVEYQSHIMDAVGNSALTGAYEDAIEAVLTSAGIISSLRSHTNELTETAVAAANDSSAAATARAGEANTFMIVMTVAVALISVAIALYISGLMSKPLIALASFMRKAGSTGDISLEQNDIDTINKFGRNTDEIGMTISGAASFVSHVTNFAHELGVIAGGDLSTDVDLLSESDTMGLSLKKMVDNLNIMFREIHMSTTEVSSGSKQVADCSQILAQGSTAQAASIQQLSGSIADISEKTKENAMTADRASKLSETIKERAEKGNRQMGDMISAVKDINDASQSISKIIKTIDDIAFQTNILALNAAVEAARAGQHGRGFAIVAEEVRNLASKSAAAAKDTEEMIQDSMEKAELGSRIAEETAVSLNEIVASINESAVLIGEIVKASGEQTESISQINTGIDQVARVVHQNNATAQESAVVSQDMNGQSDILEQLISQFKFRERGHALHDLPAREKPAQRRVLGSAEIGYAAF